MTDRGSLLVVSGPPGSGKSTVARLIAEHLARSVLVEGDALFAFLASESIEPWLPESHAQNRVVTAAAAAATGAFVRGGYDTVYDGILGPWFLDEFASGLGITGFDDAILLPSEEECVRRVATREGHGFDDEAATRSMCRQFAGHALDRHTLRGDSLSAEAVVDELSNRRAAGALRTSPRPGVSPAL